MTDVLIIEPCDFDRYPVGGQLSFAKHMMCAFGNRLGLVGVSTDETPVGRWVKKVFAGVEYDFFSFGKRTPTARRPIVPARLTAYAGLKRYKRQIMSIAVGSVFTQTVESLLVIQNWRWKSICFRFAGVRNPMPGCRYKWGRHLAWLYDRKLFAALEKVDVIIASADEDSVSGLIGRSKGRLSRDRVVQFPTRVDTDVFKPLSQDWARQVVGIPNGRGPIVVASGRICLAKGWELVHDAFAVFREKHPHAHLYFVGDGEQRPFLENRVERMNLRSHVTITGFLTREQVALYLNAADLCVVGSRREGWSNAMLEGLACGKPMVSTDVSGASAMIINGVNGYITHERDPRVFADAMRMALALQSARDVSVHLSEKYAVKSLAADLCAIWQYAV